MKPNERNILSLDSSQSAAAVSGDSIFVLPSDLTIFGYLSEYMKIATNNLVQELNP
ncbi:MULTISPECIES: hypothetical protein [Bacillus]|uniref:hypothetical protein n=1 Tax=Bacillus TaxID=1386 RepID=UPI0012E060DB|nr:MULTISPECIES: hypothetical protein [Bacillus]MCY1630898.1 hypothetical protein [Bacillus paralicheniformis]UAY70726.1 hypothetical protein K8336_01145 [Bacillus paralicheniformis]